MRDEDLRRLVRVVGAAGDRRDEGDRVAIVQRSPRFEDVLLVHRNRDTTQIRPEFRVRLAEAYAQGLHGDIGRLKLLEECVAADDLTQAGEETDGDAHG